jgi:hypothetical protein
VNTPGFRKPFQVDGSLQIPVLKIFSNPVINDIVVPLTIKAQL